MAELVTMPGAIAPAPMYGTAASFAAANPVLAALQEGVETDAGVRKLGDGRTPYSELVAMPLIIDGGDASGSTSS